jgi:hypothetical protein
MLARRRREARFDERETPVDLLHSHVDAVVDRVERGHDALNGARQL